MGPGAVFVGSIIAAVLGMFFSVMAASFGPAPGALPAALTCIIVSLVGCAAGHALKKLDDRVRALEARQEPPDEPQAPSQPGNR